MSICETGNTESVGVDTKVEYRLLDLSLVLDHEPDQVGRWKASSPPPCPIVRMRRGLRGMGGTLRRLPHLLCLDIFSPNEHSFHLFSRYAESTVFAGV